MARTSVGWLGSDIAGLYHETGRRGTRARGSELLLGVDRVRGLLVELFLQLEALVVGFDGCDGGN